MINPSTHPAFSTATVSTPVHGMKKGEKVQIVGWDKERCCVLHKGERKWVKAVNFEK